MKKILFNNNYSENIFHKTFEYSIRSVKFIIKYIVKIIVFNLLQVVKI